MAQAPSAPWTPRRDHPAARGRSRGAPSVARSLGGSLGGSLPWLVAVGVPTVVLGLHMARYGRWLIDDAGITFAYARSIVAGAGPVLQPGAAPVEGWSNPAWLAILVLAGGLGLFDHGSWFGVPDLVAFPKLLALACGAGVATAFALVTREIVPGRWRAACVAAAGGVLLAAIPSYAVWLASGLENPLLALTAAALAATLVRAVARDRLAAPTTAVTCGLLAALAALTRPDGLVYLLVLPLALLVLVRPGRAGRSVLAAGLSVLAFAVPYGGYLWWRHTTFGLWVPNTAVAKAQGWPGVTSLNRPAELVPAIGWLLVVLVAGAVGAALLRPGRHRPLLAALLVPLAAALGAYAVLEPDWMGLQRFATPVWVLGALVAAVATERASAAATGRARIATGLVAAVALVVSGTMWVQAGQRFRAGPTVPLCAVAAGVGAPPNAFGDLLGIRSGRLATPDVGGSALQSRYRIVDLAGLASAPIARFHADGDMAALRDHVLDTVRPEFIEVHGSWSRSTGLMADPRTAQRYVPIHLALPDSGYLVRRDLVSDPVRLEAARRLAREVTEPRRGAAVRDSPRASCGPLRPGSTDGVAGTAG